GGLGDGEPGPHIEEGGEVAVGPAEVDVFAAGVGHDGAEFGVGHGAEEGEDSSDDPGEIDHAGRAGGAHHFMRNEEDAAADDGSDDDSSGVGGSEDAGQVARDGGRVQAG